MASRDSRNAAQAMLMAERLASLQRRLDRERAAATQHPVGIQIPVMASVGEVTAVSTPPPAAVGGASGSRDGAPPPPPEGGGEVIQIIQVEPRTQEAEIDIRIILAVLQA
eukprot:1776747-Heterocapsa_arctica.AAC.1